MARQRVEHFIQGGTEVKRCNTCGRALPATLEYFHKDKALWDGIKHKCRECSGSSFINLPPTPREGFKFCCKCGKEYPNTAEFFKRGKSSKDGITRLCRLCHAAYNKKRREENYEVVRMREKESYILNRDKHLQNTHDYYMKNKDWFREYQRQWKASHKEEGRNTAQRRLARFKQLPITFSVEQWMECKAYFNNSCAYCGESLPLTQEHFIPLSKGGEYTHNNIIPACQFCNSSKRDRDFFVWYPKQRFCDKKREKAILKFLGYIGEVQQLALM